MAYTLSDFPGVGTTGKSTEVELLLAILNNGGLTQKEDSTELTLTAEAYDAGDMIVPSAGVQSFSLNTTNGHPLRLTGVRVFLEEAVFNTSLRISFFNEAPPAQVDGAVRIESYDQSATKIGEITLLPGSVRNGNVYIEDFTTWIDMICKDTDNTIYFNIENVNGSTGTVGKKMRIKFIGLA